MDPVIRTFFVVLFCLNILAVILLSLKSLQSYAELVFWAIVFSVPLRRFCKGMSGSVSGDEKWAVMQTFCSSPFIGLASVFIFAIMLFEYSSFMLYTLPLLASLMLLAIRRSNSQMSPAFFLTLIISCLAFFIVVIIHSMGNETRKFGLMLKELVWQHVDPMTADSYLKQAREYLYEQFPDSIKVLEAIWSADSGSIDFGGMPALLPGTRNLVESCMRLQPSCKNIAAAVVKDLGKLSGVNWSKYAGILSQYSLKLLKVLISSIDLIFECVFFVGLLNGLLGTKRSIFHYLNVVLSDLGLGQTNFVKELKDLTENIIVDVTAKATITFMSSYLTYRICWHPTAMILAVFNGLISIIPFAPSALPHVIAVSIMLLLRSWNSVILLLLGIFAMNLAIGKYLPRQHGPKFGNERISKRASKFCSGNTEHKHRLRALSFWHQGGDSGAVDCVHTPFILPKLHCRQG